MDRKGAVTARIAGAMLQHDRTAHVLLRSMLAQFDAAFAQPNASPSRTESVFADVAHRRPLATGGARSDSVGWSFSRTADPGGGADRKSVV